MSGQIAKEMPRYQSHKKVWGLKIKEISPINELNQTCFMTPEEEGYAPIELSFDYLSRHSPKAGGYYVVYEGGYKSFSPADAFEAGNTLIVTPVTLVTDKDVQETIERLDLNAPRLTLEGIQGVIASEQYHVFPDTGFTVCLLILENGFKVSGEGSCVSLENFNAQLGREIAKKDAVGKIWELEGYLLKQHLHVAAQAMPGD